MVSTEAIVRSKEFHHPYTPYAIQDDFMTALYNCIEQGNVGIFESPTGTSQLLLQVHDDEPDWMRDHALLQRKQRILQSRSELERKLDAVREKERRVRERFQNGEPSSKRRKISDKPKQDKPDDEQYLLDDYQSDDEPRSSTSAVDSELGLSVETEALMKKLGMNLGYSKAEDGTYEPEDELKIFFCSRTHSQLSQFVGELRRVSFPSSYPADDSPHEDPIFPIEGIRQLSLGSRKNLCINDKVLSLKNPTAINEKCLELQETKTPVDHRCPHLPNKENEALSLDFQHYALATIRDIEDLGTLGRKVGVCPYYATRPAIRPSEIVTLPYPLLLQKSARDALDISVKGHIVIIDEAHNLMDAILGMHTVEISLAQLEIARQQLMTYLQKFRNRLKGKNRVYVTQVVRLVDALKAFLDEKRRTATPKSGPVSQGELLLGRGVDQINLYKLVAYLQESKLARKVQGYNQSAVEQEAKKQQMPSPGNREASVPVLNHLQSFFLALTNPAAEGRFFFTAEKGSEQTKIKYLLLDPSEQFKEVVESARSIILAGGTMSPMDDYRAQLFPYLSSSRITTLSCGHVIPPSNLFVRPLSKTYDGKDFDFTFSSRNSSSMITSLGESLIELMRSIPDGAVIFFPSYSYLEHVLATWKQSTDSKAPIFSRLEVVKPVFLDVQTGNNTSTTDEILASYTAAVNDPPSSSPHRGALLLSVIGGKLSEGINFSDRLGRCVMVIGLPYPNPNSAEWKAKMEYIERKAKERSSSMNDRDEAMRQTERKVQYMAGQASREFADNVCMRAVNQAIGRAVRHKDDWAAILLVDRRYEQKRIKDKLPKWIRESMQEAPAAGERTFADTMNGLGGFYREKV